MKIGTQNQPPGSREKSANNLDIQDHNLYIPCVIVDYQIRSSAYRGVRLKVGWGERMRRDMTQNGRSMMSNERSFNE